MLSITPIKALKDNYIWLLTHSANNSAVIVDPGDAQPVIKTLQEKNLKLTAVLITHHHWDHTNGIAELKQRYDVPIYGPAHDPINPCDYQLQENDIVKLVDLAIHFKVLDIPGHTLGHIAYFAEKYLFCGDTLFTAGCGRLFEGTAEQMYQSLSKMAALPENTLVYCAHEYTASNLRFAIAVEPDNKDVQQRIKATDVKLKQGLPTVPATLALEKLTNPFLRTHLKTVQNAAQQHSGITCSDAATTFAVIRRWKDDF